MKWFEYISTKATEWAGSSYAFLTANLILVVWLVTGPFVGFSDTWQLVINTLTTLVTFDMVFLIQRTQNKDTLVVQTKLNELLASSKADNRLIDIEDLGEEEVRELHAVYQELAKRAARRNDPCARLTLDQCRAAAAEAAADPSAEQS